MWAGETETSSHPFTTAAINELGKNAEQIKFGKKRGRRAKPGKFEKKEWKSISCPSSILNSLDGRN